MSSVRTMGLTAIPVVVTLWSGGVASGTDDPTPYELVEQASQIVDDSPDAAAEALALIEAALAIESRGPTGDVNNIALQRAVLALTRGDGQSARSALATALSSDRHALHHDPLVTAFGGAIDAEPALPPAGEYGTDIAGEPEAPVAARDVASPQRASGPALTKQEQSSGGGAGVPMALGAVAGIVGLATLAAVAAALVRRPRSHQV